MFGSGREAISEVREALPNVPEGWEDLWMSGRPCRCPGVFGTSSRMSESGWETLPDVWECLEGPPGYPGGPLGFPGVVGKPSWMSGSVRKAIADVREALSDGRECSEGSPGYPGTPGYPGERPGCLEVYGRLSRMSDRPTWMSRSGQEALSEVRYALPDVREFYGDPPGYPGVVERPSQIFGSGLEAHLDVWQL